MKAIPAAALFVALGFVLAGCGSGGKVLSGSITVDGTTTISKVKTGTVVTCKGSGPLGSGGLTATVPAPSEGVVAGGHGSSSGYGKAPRSHDMRLTRSQDSALTISCNP